MNFNQLLYKAESNYLLERGRQWKIYSSYKKKSGTIDIGVASHMNLSKDIFPKGFLEETGSISAKLSLSYPSHHQTDFGLETASADFINNEYNTSYSKDHISIFYGVYGAYSTLGIMGLAQGFKKIFLTELVNQTYKACFTALGYDVIEVLCDINGLVDLLDLKKKSSQYIGDVLYFYLNHSRGGPITIEYFENIGIILSEYKLLCLYDADVLFTSHDGITLPGLPLLCPTFFQRSIILYNLTKEISLPGLRIGLGIASEDFTQKIRKYQSMILQMIPPPNRYFAKKALECVDIKKSSEILSNRVNKICIIFQKLGWKVNKPNTGVNVFLDVPNSYIGKKNNADELFVYHLIKECNILASPSSVRGASNNKQFRVVACQPVEVYDQVYERLFSAGFRFEMMCPIDLDKSLSRELSC